jgi:hypothetical protein
MPDSLLHGNVVPTLVMTTRKTKESNPCAPCVLYAFKLNCWVTLTILYYLIYIIGSWILNSNIWEIQYGTRCAKPRVSDARRNSQAHFEFPFPAEDTFYRSSMRRGWFKESTTCMSMFPLNPYITMLLSPFCPIYNNRRFCDLPEC